MNVTKDINGIW